MFFSGYRQSRSAGRFVSIKAKVILIAAATVALILGGTMAATANSGVSSRAAAGGNAAGEQANARSSAAPYLFAHDPTMAREKGIYYLFSTGDPAGAIGNGNIQIRTSRDLRNWTYRGTVFADKPAWITSMLGAIPNLWAPDISYFGGLWHLYYAGSSFGSNNSVIGLATTPTLDPSDPRYHWTDDGLVFRTTTADNFNAIDPSAVTDASGGKWLVLGSFWSGIKLIALDAASGKPGIRFTAGLLPRFKAIPRSRRGRWHRLSRRVLLPVRGGRLLLPGDQQHLPHTGGTRHKRHWPLHRRVGHRDDRRRGHGSARH